MKKENIMETTQTFMGQNLSALDNDRVYDMSQLKTIEVLLNDAITTMNNITPILIQVPINNTPHKGHITLTKLSRVINKITTHIDNVYSGPLSVEDVHQIIVIPMRAVNNTSTRIVIIILGSGSCGEKLDLLVHGMNNIIHSELNTYTYSPAITFTKDWIPKLSEYIALCSILDTKYTKYNHRYQRFTGIRSKHVTCVKLPNVMNKKIPIPSKYGKYSRYEHDEYMGVTLPKLKNGYYILEYLDKIYELLTYIRDNFHDPHMFKYQTVIHNNAYILNDVKNNRSLINNTNIRYRKMIEKYNHTRVEDRSILKTIHTFTTDITTGDVIITHLIIVDCASIRSNVNIGEKIDTILLDTWGDNVRYVPYVGSVFIDNPGIITVAEAVMLGCNSEMMNLDTMTKPLIISRTSLTI